MSISRNGGRYDEKHYYLILQKGIRKMKNYRRGVILFTEKEQLSIEEKRLKLFIKDKIFLEGCA